MDDPENIEEELVSDDCVHAAVRTVRTHVVIGHDCGHERQQKF